MRFNKYIGFVGLVSVCFVLGFSRHQFQENTPPVVEILAPVDKSGFQWNSIVSYAIKVSDSEDGNSEYEEINPNEVFLVVKYLSDSIQKEKYLMNESKTDHKPLAWMGASTCFNCHKAKDKSVGPSFNLIANKYQNDPKSIEELVQKVIKGSTGTWGDEKMPPHPDLGMAQANEMVNWILKNTADPDKNYLTGTEGAFKTKAKAGENSRKGIYVLTASYVDHGINNTMQGQKKAEQTIVLKAN